MWVQRFPALRAFWDLEQIVLHETRVSGTVGGSLLTQKIPCLHVHKQKARIKSNQSIYLED